MIAKRKYPPASTLWIACILAVAGSALLSERAASQQPKQLLSSPTPDTTNTRASGPAEEAVTSWGPRAGFEVTTVQGYLQDAESLDLSFISAEYLAQFDGIMMMTNGNLPLTDSQRAALVDFVRDGGGFIGIHCAALTLYTYPEFGEMLGAYFRRAIQQNHVFVLNVEDTDHPATRMLGDSWPIVDELYQYGTAAWTPDRPEEERGRALRQPDPDGILAGARACIAQHRHRKNRHGGARRHGAGGRLSTGLVSRLRPG